MFGEVEVDGVATGEDCAPDAEGAVIEDGMIAGGENGQIESGSVRNRPAAHEHVRSHVQIVVAPGRIVADDDEEDAFVSALEDVHRRVEEGRRRGTCGVFTPQVSDVIGASHVNPDVDEVRRPR